MEGKDDNDIFVLCATNCPWELDPAFLRRFQKMIFIDLPSRYHNNNNIIIMYYS